MTTTVLAYLPSPSQGVWHLGPVPLRAYALCIIVGIVAALMIGDRRWQARGGEPGVIYDIALWAVPFGLIGGRVYHVITDWKTYFGPTGKGLGAAFQVWEGGLGIWGAVALGAVGAWIACRVRGIPLPAFGDAIAPGIILAQGIGRLGNYFNQELYGRPTDVPWGLEIYERLNAAGQPDQLNGVSTGQVTAVVHPTFLYELVWNLAVFALLVWVDRKYRIGHGRLFALYVAAYCVGRFCIELMRSDTATEFAGIRVNTFTSTFVFIGAVVYIMLAPKGREEPESLRGKAAEVTDEDSLVDEAGKELVTAAAGTGVVAAAAVAGREEPEEATGDAESTSVFDQHEPDETAEPETDAATAALTEGPSDEAAEAIDEEAAEEAEEPADELVELEPEEEPGEDEPGEAESDEAEFAAAIAAAAETIGTGVVSIGQTDATAGRVEEAAEDGEAESAETGGQSAVEAEISESEQDAAEADPETVGTEEVSASAADDAELAEAIAAAAETIGTGVVSVEETDDSPEADEDTAAGSDGATPTPGNGNDASDNESDDESDGETPEEPATPSPTAIPAATPTPTQPVSPGEGRLRRWLRRNR